MKTGAARRRCRAHPVRRPLHTYGPICKRVFVGTAVTGAGKVCGTRPPGPGLPDLAAGPDRRPCLGLSIGSEASMSLLSVSNLVAKCRAGFMPTGRNRARRGYGSRVRSLSSGR